ncbi:hypothetical protein PSP31121_01836 [Pandoraea sputorum]|uniref:Uncharacterized protein n=1 Tax=Pandoraea sputorum TaxID=93222 RepID=A0A5E5AZ94_9BURK|nr:hypothetical protein PSP31121_01836 [Pandoraea sputorum]
MGCARDDAAWGRIDAEDPPNVAPLSASPSRVLSFQKCQLFLGKLSKTLGRTLKNPIVLRDVS